MAESRVLQSRILRSVLLLLFGGILAHLFVMQILLHDVYDGQSLENRQVRVRLRPPRGRILDRAGAILADNVYIADITLPRASLAAGAPDSTLARLIQWFALDRDSTLVRLQEQFDAGRARLTLVDDADMHRIAVVEERRRELPGARVEARASRRYPQGPLTAHLTGYVAEVSRDEVGDEADADAYRPGDWVGREGFESILDDRLRGQAGIVVREINAAGRAVGRADEILRPVRVGEDVHLTLSLALQDSLRRAMAGRRGCSVALALPSGQVLAAVNEPSYDPNLFTHGISVRTWRRLQNDPGHPFLNRMVQAAYPPGSPYKIVSSLAGLERGVVGPHTELEPCPGAYRFGNRDFRCWKRGGHGRLDHEGALVHSCDVFYYQLGLRLELSQLREVALTLGLGVSTGSPFAGESSGLIPDDDWYDRRFGERGWTRGVLLNNVIGQGEILVTPLQMAVLTGRVALERADLQPVFVLDGAAGSPTEPVPLPFEKRNLDWVRSSMTRVVDLGTGTRARLEAIDVAGKTGTAQNPHGEDHAWFVCFAPARAPEVALVILLENAGHGGAVAAPVAARWLAAYFASPTRKPEG